jgi:hypothetical protein
MPHRKWKAASAVVIMSLVMHPHIPSRCRRARCGWRPIILLSAALAAVLPAPAASAQQQRPGLGTGGLLEPGSEEERYLRALQVAGLAPSTPWSIHPLSRAQVSGLRATASHPWTPRMSAASAGATLLRPAGQLVLNSSLPVQVGNGPAWTGRGLTAQLQWGAAVALGPLHLQLAPLAFMAQNAGFDLAPNGLQGDARFADPRYPQMIDAPQRFGDGPYARVLPGSSAMSVEALGAVLAMSTLPQQWGPAREFPLVLGPSGGGFASVQLGTSRPVDLWLAKVHGRVVYGSLGQSRWSPSAEFGSRRLGSGVVALLTPRGIPTLELGATRFIHQPMPTGTLTAAMLRRPFSGGLNLGGVAENVAYENQVASLFARWNFPRARLELYGEAYREDFPGRLHEAPSLVEKPDDLMTFTLGFQRVLAASSTGMRVLRGEIVNGELAHHERNERGFVMPLPPYYHTAVTQGHTADGRFLGSAEAYGGAAWRLGMDRYTAAGRRSITVERALRMDWLRDGRDGNAPARPDVYYAVRLEQLRFARGAEYGVTVIPGVNLNRNLRPGNDVFNLAVALSLTGLPR